VYCMSWCKAVRLGIIVLSILPKMVEIVPMSNTFTGDSICHFAFE
jgi:hypothetical protein